MADAAQTSHRSRFDQLFREAAPRVLAQRHTCDVVPTTGGRWPLTAVFLPRRDQGRPLADVVEQLLPLAGPGHFCSGSPDALHVTVRALEHRREAIPRGDPATARYLGAIARAARRSSSLRLHVTGLTLTPTSVMAAITPADGRADRLAAVLAEELGPDAWREAGLDRSIWYATLLHFAAPVAQPADLVAFVADRRTQPLGHLDLDRLSLVRFDHTVEPDGKRYLRVHELGSGLLPPASGSRVCATIPP